MGARKVILDHGYLDYVEHWGSDESIIQAARMSTGKGFVGWGPVSKCERCGDLFDAPERQCPNPAPSWPYFDCGQGGHVFKDVPGDEKLLRYLYKNKHSTPFEMAGMTVEVQAPLCVFREWHRHRTQSYSEMSARYAPLPDVNYLPTVERCLMDGGGNKQAGPAEGADKLDAMDAAEWLEQLAKHYERAEKIYQTSLRLGVPKELARLALPVGRYSRMRASANLRNWLAFLTLRMDSAAQYEIRVYANAVGELIAERFPRTWALFMEGKK